VIGAISSSRSGSGVEGLPQSSPMDHEPHARREKGCFGAARWRLTFSVAGAGAAASRAGARAGFPGSAHRVDVGVRARQKARARSRQGPGRHVIGHPAALAGNTRSEDLAMADPGTGRGAGCVRKMVAEPGSSVDQPQGAAGPTTTAGGSPGGAWRSPYTAFRSSTCRRRAPADALAPTARSPWSSTRGRQLRRRRAEISPRTTASAPAADSEVILAARQRGGVI